MAWRIVQLVSIFGWGLAMALAITHADEIPQTGVGLVISTVVIDTPFLIGAALAVDLFRWRPRRVATVTGSPVRETPMERTHDLAAELVATLPLGRRDAIEELFRDSQDSAPQAADTSTQWRTGRATVPGDRRE